MAVAMIGPKFYAWDKNGKPLAFGKLYTYQARTNTPKATYQSEDQVVENTNPVILNGEGYANVYLDGSYKMVLKDSEENEIWSSDPVSANQAEEWVNCFSATYVSSTSFKIAGNQIDKYDVGRGVRVNNNASSFEYSIVESSVYAGGETSVVIADAVITTGLIGVCASIVGPNSGLDSSLRNDLSDDSGATLIGTESGLTVQEELDEIRTLTPSKNFCWAGNFDIWQRKKSFTSFPSRKAVVDGWTFSRSGFAQGATITQQAGSRGNNNALRVQRNSGDTDLGGLTPVFNLGISDSAPLVGKNVTLSFRAKAGSGFSGTSNLLTAQIKQSSSIAEQSITTTNGTYPAGDNTAGAAAVALTEDWQDFSLTAEVDINSKQVAIRFTYGPTGTAPAADYFDIEEVQLTIGESATDFIAPDIAFATMKAEEQYWKTYDIDVAEGTVNYNGSLAAVSMGVEGTNDLVFNPRFTQRMRTTPTVTAYSPQTGNSGFCSQGTTQEVPVVIVLIGSSGAIIYNQGLTPNPVRLHYVHVTAEAIL